MPTQLTLLCVLPRLPQMRHLATYMLLVLGGNATPSKADVTTALAAVGVDVSRPNDFRVSSKTVLNLTCKSI